MRLLITIFLLLGFIGCGSKTIQPSTFDDPLAPAVPISEAKPIITANNLFALDMYTNLKDKEKGENIFFSPYSISTAMAMVYEGAHQETADEIQSVFYFPENQSIRQFSFSVAHAFLNREKLPYELQAANALWVEKTFPLQNAFKEVVMEFYGGDAFNVDFMKNREGERQRINNWVEDKTKGKITNLFPPGSLHSLTRLVLTNAIYFKGKWKEPFKESETQDEDFWLNENQTKKVPMMRQTDDFYYAQTEELQILEMPYVGNELSMLIFLPKDKTYEDLNSLEKSLAIDNINLWRNSLRKQEVNVFIPKFTFERSYSLKENLQEMGISLAFEPEADFSGIINKDVEFFVDKIFHKTFVDVNEEGTEAAAATGVGMMFSSYVEPRPPEMFKADHPFIFLIQERTTGYILFMGKVVDPTK